MERLLNKLLQCCLRVMNPDHKMTTTFEVSLQVVKTWMIRCLTSCSKFPQDAKYLTLRYTDQQHEKLLICPEPFFKCAEDDSLSYNIIEKYFK